MPGTVLTARPGEVRAYTFDFSQFPEVAAGDALTGTPVVAVTPPGLTLGTPSVVAGNPASTVEVLITMGSAEQLYSLTCTCATADGSTLVCEGRLSVLF